MFTKLYEIIGKLKYSRGDIEGGLKWLEKASHGRKSFRTKVLYAYLLLKEGRLEKAERLFEELLNMKLSFDEEMLTKSNYALVLWKKGDIDAAIEMLEEVNKQYKNSINYGSLGFLYIVKGDMEKALAFNMEAYEYNSANTVILDNLGQTYFLRKEYDQAKEIYEKLISLNPAFPEAYYNYGLVLLAQDCVQMALETMKKSLNYKFSFLSTVTKAEVEAKIADVECKM